MAPKIAIVYVSVPRSNEPPHPNLKELWRLPPARRPLDTSD